MYPASLLKIQEYDHSVVSLTLSMSHALLNEHFHFWVTFYSGLLEQLEWTLSSSVIGSVTGTDL